jgi:hypothetical protein
VFGGRRGRRSLRSADRWPGHDRQAPALAGLRPKAGRRGGPAAGSVTLEATTALGLLVLLGLAIVGGRIAVAGGAVEEAARDAARQASIARDAGAAG